MAGLFIELYLDEDVSVLVADLLRGRGFAVTTTRDEHRLGSSDESQLAYAADNGMTLLSHNRVDFETLAREYAQSDRPHGGIILSGRHSPYELVRRLLLILDQVSADEMRDLIRYI